MKRIIIEPFGNLIRDNLNSVEILNLLSYIYFKWEQEQKFNGPMQHGILLLDAQKLAPVVKIVMLNDLLNDLEE